MKKQPKPKGIWEFLLVIVLKNLKFGEFWVKMRDGRQFIFKGKKYGPIGKIELKDDTVCKRIVLGGGMGLAEGYINGCWETENLDNLLEMAALNLSIKHPFQKLPNPLDPINILIHKLRPNTKKGSKKNIASHYDISNDFYNLWLDAKTLAYSSGIFEKKHEGPIPFEPDISVSLEEAQIQKWERLLELLDVKPNQTLLEIGCGWGGFAIYAAKTRKCKVTGVTNSNEMAAGAIKNVKKEGLESQIEIKLMDYRDIVGDFDRIASIEMFEAVGEQYWGDFFKKIRLLLKDNGKIALQTITIDKNIFYKYRRRADFIQKYIFPGGMLPSPEIFKKVSKKFGLEVKKEQFFGQHYAYTLELWEKKFLKVIPQIKKLGLDDKFIRMWHYYFSYCRAGFKVNRIDDMQVLLKKS